MRKKKNIELRVVCLFGSYGIHKCVLDEDGDVVDVGDNVLAKQYPSFSEMIDVVNEIISITSLNKKCVVVVNICNRKMYGV